MFMMYLGRAITRYGDEKSLVACESTRMDAGVRCLLIDSQLEGQEGR
jgi:hypothetical protein